MTDPQIEIEALCEVHPSSGRVVVWRASDRIVLDLQVTCLWRYLVPAPVFGRRTPAGRWLRDAPDRLLAASRFQFRCRHGGHGARWISTYTRWSRRSAGSGDPRARAPQGAGG